MLENSRLVRHKNAIGDIVYVEKTGVYQKLDFKKEVPYRITEVFTDSTVDYQTHNHDVFKQYTIGVYLSNQKSK